LKLDTWKKSSFILSLSTSSARNWKNLRANQEKIKMPMNPSATSTPKPVSVFQEKQTNIIDVKFPTRKVLKENKSNEKPQDYKAKQKKPSHRPRGGKRDQEDEKLSRAIEAIKIQENRRQRMQGAENLDPDKIACSTKSCDAISEQKRLEAKQQKETRILKHLAEQEALKNKPEDQAKNLIVKRSQFPNFHPRSPMCYKPRASDDTCSNQVTLFGGEPKVDILQMLASPFMSEIYVQPRFFIRYTKDELRSLNPYGFYFM
jgi:hypothetical protein